MSAATTDWETEVPAHVVRAIRRTLDEAGIFVTTETPADLEEIVVDGVAFILGEEEFAAVDESSLLRTVKLAVAQKFPR